MNTAAFGSVLGLLGSGFDAFGQYQQGKEEKWAQDYNATIANQQAQSERRNAKVAEYISRKELNQAIGAQRMAYAKSGVAFSGSAIDVMVDSIANAELGMAIDRYNSEIAARGLDSEAAVRRYYGKQATNKALTNVGNTLLGGVSKAAINFGS